MSTFVLCLSAADWAAIATAVGTLMFAVIEVLQDRIRALVMRPVLKVRVRVAPPADIETATAP